MAHLDTLLRSLPAWRERYTSFRSSGARRTLAIAALNIALVWCVVGAVIWQGYRHAVADGKRMAANFSLATAAYTQQALVATDLMLRSMQDWGADEDIQSETRFNEMMRSRRFHDAMRDRIVGLPQVSVASVFNKEGHLLSSSLDWPAPPTDIGQRESFQTQIDPASPALSSSAALIDPNTKRWTFYFSRKIRSKADRLLGVAVVGIDSEYFANLFRSISLGEDSSVSLFRLDGALLATTLETSGLMGRTYDSVLPVRMIRESLSGTTQFTREPRWWSPSNSESRIVAARQVDGFPFLVAVTIAEETMLNQWRQRLYLIVALALLVSTIAGLVTAHLLHLGGRAESAARRAAERRVLAALADTPAALYAVIDWQGRVIYCNDRFRQVVAADHEPDSILRDTAVRGAAPLLAFAAENDGHSIEVDLEVARPDQASCFLHFSASHQSLPETGPCTILVGQDETLRRQAQHAISQAAKLVTLGEMTTGMAHELSQPLNVIMMAAQNALSEVAPSEPRDPDEGLPAPLGDAELRPFVAGKLNRIMAQVDRAGSIIAGMRVFGRALDGHAAVFDVRDACRKALALVGQRLRTGSVTVREELGQAPLQVRGHQKLLEQALVNLLLNARDALQQSTQADKTITLSARCDGAGHVLLTVADNGPGVPAGIRERIFEPFFTSKPSGQGMGLGLSLSLGIVRESGGTLSLVPSDGGAAFQIDLPGTSQREA